MSKILVIFILLQFSTADNYIKYNRELLGTFKNIVNIIFENTTSVCYIYEKNYVTQPKKLLKFIRKPLQIIQYSKLKFAWIRNEFLCEGYIVNIRNFTSFKSFLNDRSEDTHIIRPHKRMIIVYEGEAKIHFPELLGIYAMNVIELELPSFKQSSLISKKAYTKGFRVVCLEKEKVLFQWNLNDSHHYIDVTKFEQKPWNPDNLFKRSNYSFRFSIFDCDPFIRLDENNNILGGPEINLAKEMIKGFPVKWLLSKDITSKKFK